MIKYILLVGFILLFSIVYGCSCSGPSVDLPIKEMGISLDNNMIRGNEESIVFEGILIDRIEDLKNPRNPDIGHLFEVTDVYNQACIDSVIVWTPPHSAACGFSAQKNEYSIVVANLKEDGRYYNYRSDCMRGVSKHLEPERFNTYRKFLTSIKYGINGDYVFDQRPYYWPLNHQKKVPQLIYSIIGHKLNDRWWLYNKSGFLLEAGIYSNGKKSGIWKILENINGNFSYTEVNY